MVSDILNLKPSHKKRIAISARLLIAAALIWSGWQAWTRRQDLAEARDLGFNVNYTGPWDCISAGWTAVFHIETWTNDARFLTIPRANDFERHYELIRRLNPRGLHILDTGAWPDLSAFKEFSKLEFLEIGSTDFDEKLTSLNGIEGMDRIRVLRVFGSKGLTNVDAVTKLHSLKYVDLTRCSGLSQEAVESLKSALPNARIRVR